MHIKRCSARLLHAPLNQPFRIATGQHSSLANCLFMLELADGTKGFGEAGVAPHITGETVEKTLRNLERSIGVLEGGDIADYSGLAARIRGLFPQNMSAVAAVEMALLDAFSRYLKVPLWRLFGDKSKRLVTDITLVIGDLEETVSAATYFYKQGFRTFKIKIGRDPGLDLERVMQVKKLCPRAGIYLDANQAFGAREMLRFLSELKKAGVRPLLLEQPVSKKDWEGLKEVSRKSFVPVCADESASSMGDCLRIIREKAVPCVNIKVMKTGMLVSREIAAACRAAGIRLMIGAMMESSLSTTASAHIAAGMGCFDFIDLDTPFFIKRGFDRNPYLSPAGVYELGRVKEGIGIVPVITR